MVSLLTKDKNIWNFNQITKNQVTTKTRATSELCLQDRHVSVGLFDL